MIILNQDPAEGSGKADGSSEGEKKTGPVMSLCTSLFGKIYHIFYHASFVTNMVYSI